MSKISQGQEEKTDIGFHYILVEHIYSPRIGYHSRFKVGEELSTLCSGKISLELNVAIVFNVVDCIHM